MLRAVSRSVLPFRLVAVLCVSVVVGGCGAASQPGADWPPTSKRWFDRGEASFQQGDFDDAETSVENALRVTPNREEVRILAARIALAKLEYERTIQVLTGLDSNEARSLRGRAYWYAGDIDKAADELDRLIADPAVRDPWAVDIAKLARRGTGRKPFEMSGGLLAITDMPRTGTASMIVPLDINGEPGLGLIATGEGEAVVDSGSGSPPSWVSLRFGDRLEVRDVPARAKDLSGISRQVNAPIKILLGVDLLRHLHPTFDLIGGQFVVRRYEPPPPPVATTLKVNYVRGGAMVVRGAFGSDASAPEGSFLVDTSVIYPLALDESGWKKAGVAEMSLRTVPNGGGLKEGIVPLLKLGAYELPSVPALSGDRPLKEREESLGVDLDGLIGAGLLANFRVTLADDGRTMWLENMPRQVEFGPEAPPTSTGPTEDGAAPGAAAPDAAGVDDGKAATKSKPSAGKRSTGKPSAGKVITPVRKAPMAPAKP